MINIFKNLWLKQISCHTGEGIDVRKSQQKYLYGPVKLYIYNYVKKITRAPTDAALLSPSFSW